MSEIPTIEIEPCPENPAILAKHKFIPDPINHPCLRDPKNGHYLPGNRTAHGNAMSKSAREMRTIYTACITQEDIKAVYAKLLDLALGGNPYCIKLYLEFALGRPQQSVTLESQSNQEVIWTVSPRAKE